MDKDKDKDRYVLVPWPDSQDYMELEGYSENSVPNPRGDGDVFIRETWKTDADLGLVPRIPDPEDE